eukprot:Partr_v1_DN28108_c0_g1_i1_m55730 putative NA
MPLYEFLDDEYKALAYAQRTDFGVSWKPTVATMLSGGYCNYVYRIADDHGHSLVIKQYPPFARYNPSVPLSNDRFKVEYEALKFVASVVGKESIVKVPHVYSMDEAMFCIAMQDIGTGGSTLTDMLEHSKTPLDTADGRICGDQWPELDAQLLARSLYQFFASIASRRPESPVFENQSTWNTLARFYGTFTQIAESINRADIMEVAARVPVFGPPVPRVNTFMMGDLWPNSIFIDPLNKSVWILDWEVARLDYKEKDCNQLMDNLWLMMQNPKKYRAETCRQLIEEICGAYYGSKDANWMESHVRSGDQFVRSVTLLSSFPHWELGENATSNISKLAMSLVAASKQ